MGILNIYLPFQKISFTALSFFFSFIFKMYETVLQIARTEKI